MRHRCRPNSHVGVASRLLRNREHRKGQIFSMRRPKHCGIQANAADVSFQDERTRWGKPTFDAISISNRADDWGAIASPEARMGNPSDKDLQRAEGAGRIVLSGSEKGTRILDVFQRSPIRIMFPRTASGPVEEAVSINTAGGCPKGRAPPTPVPTPTHTSLQRHHT